MAIIRRYKTRKEAEDTMVDIIENINGYGKMSMTEVINWIGAEKELSHDPVEAGVSFDDIGWVKSSTTDFEVDKAKVGYIIFLPEPRPLVKYPKTEPAKTMSIRGFADRKSAEDLLSILIDMITEYGQLSIEDVFKGLSDSTQWLCEDDTNMPVTLAMSKVDETSTGWVTADGVKFWVDHTNFGYWIRLTESRPLVKYPNRKGALEASLREMGVIGYEENAHKERDQRAAKLIEKLAQNGAISEGLKEGMLEAVTSAHGIEASKGLKQIDPGTLNYINEKRQGLGLPLFDECLNTEAEAQKNLEDYCDEDVRATQQAFENHILRSQANSFYGSASSEKEPPFYSARAGYIKQRALEREKKDAKFYSELEKGINKTLEEVFIEGMKVGQGEKVLTEHGAMRESNEGRGRFDLIPYESMEALAIWSEQGAIKYGDRNWEKGLSVKDCINRLIRHALKAGSGWTDEDHLAAAMWNASAAITMMKRRPDCDDHVWLTKATGADLQAADEYHNAGLESTVAWRERLVAQNAGLGVEFHSCPYCGHMDPKEKWGFYPTPHDTLIYTCKECRKSHEEVIPDEDIHQCSFCGYIEPTSKWKKEPINGYISIYTCKECGKEHEWREKI